MPALLKFADAKEWRLGKPDLIVSSQTVDVAAVQRRAVHGIAQRAREHACIEVVVAGREAQQ